MQCVREYGVLDEQIQNEIASIVENDKTEFAKSKLYSTEKDLKFVDENKRTSVFKEFRDEKLFIFIDKLIDKINAIDNYYEFMLYRNDITYIKYSKGGFFEKHQDYLSVTSNFMEEFTFILCVDADCFGNGGETILYINEYFKHKSLSTITPKHSLLFRKDIKHQALIINDGYKHILTMNLWGFIKNNNYDQKNVVITFKNNKQMVIVIPLSNILSFKQTKLAQKLMNNYHDDINNKKTIILRYVEDELTYKEFQICSKIYNKCYIDKNEFNLYRNKIFSQNFKYSNLLINFNPDRNIQNEESKLLTSNMNESQLRQKIVELKEEYHFTEKQILEKHVMFVGDKHLDFKDIFYSKHKRIILCKNTEQQIFMLDIIKSDKVQYIPFKIIFAEGTISQDAEPTVLKMQPVWLSVGELNNVLFYNQADSGWVDEKIFNLKKYVKCLYKKKTIIPQKQLYQNKNICIKQQSKSAEELRLECEQQAITYLYPDQCTQEIKGVFDRKCSVWNICESDDEFPICAEIAEMVLKHIHIAIDNESISSEELRFEFDFGHILDSKVGYTLIDLFDGKEQNPGWGNPIIAHIDNFPALINVKPECEDFDVEIEETEIKLSTDKTPQITTIIDRNNDKLLYQSSNVVAWRWDNKQCKWRWRGQGQICIYHNKLKSISRIIFKDNNHDKIRLLQYIDGNKKCISLESDTFTWFGADYSMNKFEPINSAWKIKISDAEDRRDNGFRNIFNAQIEAFNSYFVELLYEHNPVTISKWDQTRNIWLDGGENGTISVYYNKQKCTSKIMFVTDDNDLKLLQHIDGKTYCKFRIDDMKNNNDWNEISSIVEWVGSDDILYSMQILPRNRWSWNKETNKIAAQQFLNIFNEKVDIFNGIIKNKQFISSVTMADLVKLIIPRAFEKRGASTTKHDDILVDIKNHDDIERYNKLNYLDKRFIYHIDNKTNKMVLNERYFNEIREEIDFVRLTDYVSKNINDLSKHYTFNQMNKSFSGYLCNENVYGNLNLIECTGFIYIPLKQIDNFIVNALPDILTDYVCDPSVSQIIISYLPLTYYPCRGTKQFIFRPFKQCNQDGIKKYYQHICVGYINLETFNKSIDELRLEDQYHDDDGDDDEDDDQEIYGKFNKKSQIWKFGENNILQRENNYEWYQIQRDENKKKDIVMQ